MATIREIAEQSCVSPALVSRVLNNKPGVWASVETRQRILDTARILNYQPSASARSLVTGRTMQIAISTADPGWHKGTTGRLLEVGGIIEAAASESYRVLILPSLENHAKRSEFEALLQSKICDGICLYAEQADRSLYDWLRRFDIPFVVIGHPGEPDLCYADQDNYNYAYTSVQWLQQHGHQRIVWSSPSDEKPFEQHVQHLKAGYRCAMNDLCPEAASLQDDLMCLNADEVARLIGKPNAPTAAIVRGLASAMQWKLALQMQDISLPDEFVLLAHLDPTELAFLEQGNLSQGIACHLHDPKEVGLRATRALIQWIVEGAPQSQEILVTPPGAQWCEELPSQIKAVE